MSGCSAPGCELPAQVAIVRVKQPDGSVEQAAIEKDLCARHARVSLETAQQVAFERVKGGFRLGFGTGFLLVPDGEALRWVAIIMAPQRPGAEAEP